MIMPLDDCKVCVRLKALRATLRDARTQMAGMISELEALHQQSKVQHVHRVTELTDVLGSIVASEENARRLT
jgi:hypothetical protein